MRKLVLVVALSLLHGIASAEVDQKVESLRGVKKLSVLVEDLNPDLEKDGVTKSQLQTDVEVRLRKAGLTVDGNEGPYLYVRVSAVKYEKSTKIEPFYVLGFSVFLNQPVTVVSNGVSVYASTWEKGSVAICGLSGLDCVRRHVAEKVDLFLRDYLSVNPPARPVKE